MNLVNAHVILGHFREVVPYYIEVLEKGLEEEGLTQASLTLHIEDMTPVTYKKDGDKVEYETILDEREKSNTLVDMLISNVEEDKFVAIGHTTIQGITIEQRITFNSKPSFYFENEKYTIKDESSWNAFKKAVEQKSDKSNEITNVLHTLLSLSDNEEEVDKDEE
ncbi:hypothetical protein DWQ65_02965 [Treponema phagedenis]|uniref:hypothetical protein n=1 Tax=Treponema phagedenis TaxID=162 RepID=UPI0001F63BF7|nr:hypothetical protein [Treponema phagedenis]EFW38161.1 hypothetical protein HMPREF9554_01349 [Treponema phagedenis F0421]QSH99055.1 hypothetical protein DWQ65_02965 [Treponema phagedenis]TYT79369.1 hypothetical protein FS559_09850 [Treponema phagedenis]